MRVLSRLLLLALAGGFIVLPTATAQSRLTAERQTADAIVLGWPATTPPATLEVSAALGASAAWQPVTITPVLANGRYSLTVGAANGTPRFYRLRQEVTILTKVDETSPAADETGVSVTRESILRLSAPLAADTTLSSATFYATALGRRLLTRPEISADHRALTLFYLENLPAGARVTVFLDGTALKDSQGRSLDADGDGQPGGIGTLGFETMGISANGQTAVLGHVYASSPNPDGSNRPLVNVTITVDGAEETLRTVTDSDGRFTLSPAPVGRFFVHVDGRTAVGSQWPDGAYYPFVGKAWETIVGKTNNLASGTGEIFLPLIAAQALKAISSTNETVVGFTPEIVAANPALAGVAVIVPPNALFSDGGTRGGKLGLAPVPPDRLPEPLPPGLEFPLVITVQTDGPQNFDQPIPVRFPNLPDPKTGQTLPPGSKTLLWSFNHDTGRWEPQGTMTISADGKFAVSDPGVGLRQPGWHGVQQGNQGHGPSRYRWRHPGDPGRSPDPDHRDPDCADGEDCECTQEILCYTPHEGKNYAICALSCLGDVVKQLFGSDPKPEASPIDAGIRCIGGPDRCPGYSDDVLTADQRKCMDACRWPDSDIKKYTMPCEGYLDPCPSAALHGGPLSFGIATGETPLTDRLEEQVFFWNVQTEYYRKYFGTPKITQLDYPELPFIHALFDAFHAATRTETPNGIHLSAAERASLVALPRPAVFSAGDWTALIDRLDSLQGAALPADVAAAETKFNNAVALLQSRGWKHHADGLLQGLVRNSWARAVEPGSETFPARRHFFVLKDFATGFEQRGRLNSLGQFEGILLTANSYFSVSYLDPVTLRSGAAFFRSESPGSDTPIPTAPLQDAPTSDGDADGDGLADASEDILGTNPQQADTDGDGLSDRVEVLNGTRPDDGSPAVVGVIANTPTPGTAMGVVASGDFAFVADDSAGLTVLRLNGYAAPTLLTSLDLGGNAQSIAADGSLAVLGLDSRVAFVTITNPASPRVLRTVNLDATVQALSLSGSETAVAAGRDILVLDTATSAIKQRFTPSNQSALDVYLEGGRMFAVTSQELLAYRKVDEAWQFMGLYRRSSSSGDVAPGHRLLVRDQVALVGFNRGIATGIHSYDVSDFSAIKELTPVAPAAAAIEDLAETGSKWLAAVGSPPRGIQLYDVSNPLVTPKLLSSFGTRGAAQQSTLHNGVLLVADAEGGLTLLNLLPPDRGTNAPVVTVRLVNDNAVPRAEFGSSSTFLVQGLDDVGIRELELEYEGQLIARGGSARLIAQVVVPTKASGRTSFSVRARATDLAGNRAWSDPLVVALVDDATPPSIASFSPPNLSVVVPSCLSTLAVGFAEPLASGTGPDALQLFTAGVDRKVGTADDVPVPGTTTYEAATRRLIFTPASPVGAGPYRAVLAAGLGDASGNLRALPLAWTFQDAPLARAAILPPFQSFALGVPLETFTVVLDHPLCEAGAQGLEWKLTQLARNEVPQQELTPLHVEVAADLTTFRLRSPVPLGTGRYRIEATGAGLQSIRYEFDYRNTPNEVTGTGNNSVAVWKYFPNILPGDSLIVDLPNKVVSLEFPNVTLQKLVARTDVIIRNQDVRVVEPIEFGAGLSLEAAKLTGASSDVRGPLQLINGGVSLRDHTLAVHGGGYLDSGLYFLTTNAAFINQPGSSLVVSNGLNDQNTPDGYGRLINLGTLRGESTDSSIFPVRLQHTRLSNGGRIEIARGFWYAVNVENDGEIVVGPNTQFVFAQRLRGTASSRIHAEGSLIFGDYDANSRRVLRAADAEIQGEVTSTGPMVVAGGNVTIRSRFVRSIDGLQVQHPATKLEFLAAADLRSVQLSESAILRFNSDSRIGDLSLDGFGEVGSADLLTITGKVEISQGLTASGRGVLDFRGRTVMTNFTQSTAFSVTDATVRNSGTWSVQPGGSLGAAFSLRRVGSRWGNGAFENRGVFEHITARPLSIEFPFRNFGRASLAAGIVQFEGVQSLTSPGLGRFEPQPGSELRLNGTTLVMNQTGPLDLTAGTLTGYGTVRVNGNSPDGSGYALTNRATIRLSEPGQDLSFDPRGGFTQSAEGVLEITLAGEQTPRMILLRSGPHHLGGTLRIVAPVGFAPSLGQTFVVVTHNTGAREGEFARVEVPEVGPGKKLQVQYLDNAVQIAVVAP